MTKRRRAAGGLLAAIAAATLACKGGSASPSSTTPTTTPVATATVTISASGVSPKDVVISQGMQVTFTNGDSRNHEMDSDPHPEHTECPAINSVDFLAPG